MTAFADLILPDTTYLERHDVMSMLDRPISEFDGPVDSVRIPVLPPSGRLQAVPGGADRTRHAARSCRPSSRPRAQRKYRDYPDFIVNWETEPGSGIGFLAGWRGKGGEKFLIGEPNPRQWEMYEQHNCVYHHELPRSYQYMRNWNQGYLEWSRANRITRYAEPILIHLYSEVLQRFRSAAQGKGLTRKPPEHLKKRIETYFDPLPFFYEPLESHVTDKHKYPLAAVTQRPMAMYHSWDSQNAWLRQIHTYNLLHINTQTARAAGIADGDWVWVESQWGRVRCKAAHSQAVEPGTVWTWNAIGKAAGAWNLAGDANESREGFLLNHVISEELPVRGSDARVSNSDPITGQAAWYDVRVRVVKAGADEPQRSEPQFQPMRRYPGMAERAARAGRAGTAAPLSAEQGQCDEPAPARPGHRPQRLRGLPRLRHQLQGMEQQRRGRADERPEPLRRRPQRHLLQPRADLRGGRVPVSPRRCTSRRAACTAKTRPACRCAPPAPRTSAPRTASCWSTTTSASAASTAAGPAPTARASSTRTRR